MAYPAIIPILSKKQLSNMELVYETMKKKNITNQFIQAGIMATVAKETAFTLTEEFGYDKTSNIQYIRNIFGDRIAKFSDKQIIDLKGNPKAWFDYLYGGVYGNSEAVQYFSAIGQRLPKSEGYFYRGRGFNGVTFRGIYKNLKRYASGKDIEKDPLLLNSPIVAADVLIGYYIENWAVFPQVARAWNQTTINSATNLSDALGAAIHITGGGGRTRQGIENLIIKTNVLEKINSFVVEFYQWILKKEGQALPEGGIQSVFGSGVVGGASTAPTVATSNTATSGVDSTSTNNAGQQNSRGDIPGQSRRSNPANRKPDDPKRKITQITQPTLKATTIRIPVPKDPNARQEYKNIAIVPFIWYGSYQIEYKDVSFFQLYTVGNLPSIKLVFDDTLKVMDSQGFPLDDSLITVFINPRNEQLKPIHMDFKITKFTSDKRTYTINGVINANQLYIKKFKSFSKKTTFETLKEISSEIGLGFCSNIDDTNDSMTWICTGQKYTEFIETLVYNSYKSDDTYLSAYIDYYYNLTYVDVEKEYIRNIKEELGIGDIGLSQLIKDKKSAVHKLILTNDKGYRDSNVYFPEYKIINNSTSISLSEGYGTKLKYYDQNKKDFLIFDLEGLTSPGNDKIILKGKPQDEKFYNENKELVYLGKLDDDNMFPDYHYSYIQNYRNLVELSKIVIEIYMASPNYNLYRYQKIIVAISNQSPSIQDSHMSGRLTGEWLIVDIIYRYESTKFTQVVKLIKRELELTNEEKKEETFPKSKNKDTGRGTFTNPDPTPQTTSGEPTTGTQSGGTASGTASVTDNFTPDTYNESDGMAYSVPAPPKNPTKSSPSNFPIKSTAWRKTVRKPNQIILHYTAGWQLLDKSAGTITFLMQRGRGQVVDKKTGATTVEGEGLSYHYIIGPDGHIENLVDPQYIAQHSGDPCDNTSIGISLMSLGTTYNDYGIEGAKKEIDRYRKSSNSHNRTMYGKNEDYVHLVDFNGQQKKYKGFSFCQEVSVAQIGALNKLLKELKNRFPTLPSYNGLTQEHFDIMFPPQGSKNGTFGCPSWKQGVTGIYSHCSITSGKLDIGPTPRLVEFFKRLRL
jgi:predicted chitinase